MMIISLITYVITYVETDDCNQGLDWSNYSRRLSAKTSTIQYYFTV